MNVRLKIHALLYRSVHSCSADFGHTSRLASAFKYHKTSTSSPRLLLEQVTSAPGLY